MLIQTHVSCLKINSVQNFIKNPIINQIGVFFYCLIRAILNKVVLILMIGKTISIYIKMTILPSI